MSRRSWSGRDERGVSLILVLVTLVVFGLIVPVLGQFGSTNGVSGFVLKGQRFDRYAAEAGMQGAIQWAQGQRQAGRQGNDCPSLTTDASNGGGVNAHRNVTVTCAGFNGTGRPQDTPSMPKYALLALGGGQAIKFTGAGTLQTDGPWWSNGSIAKGSATVEATADYVGASGTCTEVVASPADCGQGGHEDDPGWSLSQPAPITVDPIRSACDLVQNGVATITPGLHWDQSLFAQLGAGACGTRTIYLEPGLMPHVFDFSFYGRRGANWTIDPGSQRVTVRSGTTTAGVDTCAAPDVASPVLFAGNFTMEAKAGVALRLCGGLESGQQIAVAQVTNGDDPQATTPDPSSPASSIAVDGHGDPFDFGPGALPVAALRTVECVPQRSGCTLNGGYISGRFRDARGTGEVTVEIPDQVPDGAWLKTLTIELTHQELEGFRDDLRALRVWITGLPGDYDRECDLSRDSNEVDPSNDWTTASESSVTCDVSGAHVPYFSTNDLQLHVAIDTNGSHREGDRNVDPDVTLNLDHIALRATFVPPGYRTSAGFDDPLLHIDQGATIRSDGTAYVPTGVLDVDFGGATDSVFARGVVAKAVEITGLPGVDGFAPFQLVGGGAYTDRLATFEARLEGEADPILTARVRFCDPQPEGGFHGNQARDTADGCAGAETSPAKILAWDPTK